ncbi:MAG TPA: signal peptidase II [Segeticoccus sp.]|uniref:signal peptidase II n=1 Tax=Segeticoccus sp. TaxID=2706531 RepID=UPI002D7EF95A|nr:signal peptidase II [Segeticoccus sp.]HET8599693.1 signal peptidase II [Segeticoccus sp.]
MQAARGASLTSDRTDPGCSTPPARRASRASSLTLVGLLAAAGLALDQWTKHLAVQHLADHGISLAGGLLRLTLARNPGAAFSTGTSYTPVISLIAIAATVVVCVVALRTRNRTWAVALGLLLAGVLGNLVDRLAREPGPLRGHVVDFLELPHWPVFNVADICINIAALLILVQVVRGVRLDGSRHHEER